MTKVEDIESVVPCPFCGEDLDFTDAITEFTTTYYVECFKCKKYFIIFPTEWEMEEYDPEA